MQGLLHGASMGPEGVMEASRPGVQRAKEYGASKSSEAVDSGLFLKIKAIEGILRAI